MKLIKLFESGEDLFGTKVHESEETRKKHLNIKLKFLKKELPVLLHSYGVALDNVKDILQKKYNITSSGVFNSGSPGWVTPEVQNFMRFFHRYIARKEQVQASIKDIRSQQLQAKHPEEYKVLSSHRAESSRRGWDPVIPNPAKITVPATPGSIDNPFWHSRSMQPFTGRPWDYPLWTSHRLQEYVFYSAMLKRARLQEFTKMYSSVYDNKHRNFVMVGDNGNIVWRVYDVGAGSEQNWMFINGTRYHASDFNYNNGEHKADIAFAAALHKKTMKFSEIVNTRIVEVVAKFDLDSSNEEYHKQQSLMKSDPVFNNNEFESIEIQKAQIEARYKSLSKEQKVASARKAQAVDGFIRAYQDAYGIDITGTMKTNMVPNGQAYREILNTPEGALYKQRTAKLDRIIDLTNRSRVELNQKLKAITSIRPHTLPLLAKQLREL